MHANRDESEMKGGLEGVLIAVPWNFMEIVWIFREHRRSAGQEHFVSRRTQTCLSFRHFRGCALHEHLHNERGFRGLRVCTPRSPWPKPILRLPIKSNSTRAEKSFQELFPRNYYRCENTRKRRNRVSVHNSCSKTISSEWFIVECGKRDSDKWLLACSAVPLINGKCLHHMLS